ncbi:hypothetical protein JRQ81_001207 [Phrynocephalus forsythii]|uniref:Envelope glycoprotein n=1 Tax=Phrynocephalus forsythii TaxID=171643 RepID=A0A9Q1B865_9SAUR|nr:hypothetical protein JRQ81_001207 [Phrynocephalus forsythii]
MDIQAKLQAEIVSIKNMVLQHRLAIDKMLLHHGGLCAYINQPCCMYHDASKGLVLDHDELANLVRKNGNDRDTTYDELNSGSWDWDWLTSWMPDFSALRYIVVGIVALIILGIIVGIISRILPFCLTLCTPTRPSAAVPRRADLNSALFFLSEL